MEDSGLKDVWVESGIYGENTADNILKGKQWNCAFHAHKLTFEALWRMFWPVLKAWAQENDS